MGNCASVYLFLHDHAIVPNQDSQMGRLSLSPLSLLCIVCLCINIYAIKENFSSVNICIVCSGFCYYASSAWTPDQLSQQTGKQNPILLDIEQVGLSQQIEE